MILIPFTKWYLRKERSYRKGDITVAVLPGVFHPGLFYSTNFLLDYLKEQDLKNKSLLELGCGSGLLSIAAAKWGAHVTASDLSKRAVENTKRNAEKNNVTITTIHSDLFDSLPPTAYDRIVINPPYYGQIPKSEEELAWHCGENHEYFTKLFSQMRAFISETSRVIMVLTKGCDLDRIKQIASSHQYIFELIREKDVLFDGKDFLFEIKSVELSQSQLQ